jgi:hypothetical protein
VTLERVEASVFLDIYTLKPSIPYIMGCSESSNELIGEEGALFNIERKLGYSLRDVLEIDLIMRKYSMGGFVNEHHLASIFKQLDLSHSSHTVVQFYNTFKAKEVYLLQDLLVLGIMFGSGSAEIKARLLFEAYNVQEFKHIDKNSVKNLFRLMFEICVERFEILVKEESDILAEYLDELKHGRPKLKTRMIGNVLKGEDYCSLDGFINRFRDEEMGKLLTGTGFRKALKENISKIYMMVKSDNAES